MAATRIYFNNTTSSATLDSSIGTGDTSLSVTGLANYPTVPFIVAIDRGTASAELLKVTNVTGGGATLTVTRAYDGTSAASHSGGAVIEHVIPAGIPNDASEHINATTNVHGISGTFVDTASAQTITNKTIEDGVYESTHSTSPAGPSAAFLVNADDATARSGFQVEAVGGDADVAAFIVTISGGTRFRVKHTGNVYIDPSDLVELAVHVDAGDVQFDGNETVGGNLTVTGTAATGAQTVSGGVTATGAVAGASVAATGAVTGASAAISGAATVGTTLGVSGAATFGSTLASGTQTVTGDVGASGDVTAAGTVTGGDLSANSGGFATTTVDANNTRVDSDVSNVAGNTQQSVRQGVVHEFEGTANVTPAGAEDTIFTQTWTQKETGHVRVNVQVTIERSDSGAEGTVGQNDLRMILKDTSGGTERYNSGLRWHCAAYNGTFNAKAKTTYSITKSVDDYQFIAGTSYTLVWSALSDSTYNAGVKHSVWDASIEEVVVVE